MTVSYRPYPFLRAGKESPDQPTIGHADVGGLQRFCRFSPVPAVSRTKRRNQYLLFFCRTVPGFRKTVHALFRGPCLHGIRVPAPFPNTRFQKPGRSGCPVPVRLEQDGVLTSRSCFYHFSGSSDFLIDQTAKLPAHFQQDAFVWPDKESFI